MTESLSVLYVEDDEMSREIMDMLLREGMGLHHVTILPDSADFLAKALQVEPRPDVVLLDIHVRPYSGFEMLAQLRDQPAFAATPVVALTASVMNEEVEQLKTAGFNSVLPKPIDSDTFPDRLQRIMNGESLWHITN